MLVALKDVQSRDDEPISASALTIESEVPTLGGLPKQLAILFDRDGLEEPMLGGDGCLHYPEESDLL